MGLFSKLKSDLNHGGVKVHVQAPSSIASDQVIPVSITVAAADSPQTVNSVKAVVQAEARSEGISLGGNNMGGVGVQESQTTYRTVAQVESREQFSLGAGESKTVNLQLYLNGGAAGAANPFGQVGGALGGALQAVANVAQHLDNVNYIYRIEGSAKLDGVGTEPHDKVPIQLLPPSQNQVASQPSVNNFAQPQPEQPLPAQNTPPPPMPEQPGTDPNNPYNLPPQA